MNVILDSAVKELEEIGLLQRLLMRRYEDLRDELETVKQPYRDCDMSEAEISGIYDVVMLVEKINHIGLVISDVKKDIAGYITHVETIKSVV